MTGSEQTDDDSSEHDFHFESDTDHDHDFPESESLSKQYDISMYDTEQLSHTPLYDGAALSVMDSLVKYLHWFSSHPSISKEALSDILRMEHYEVLPQGNRLPSSYHDAMKLVEPFLIQPIVFHVCSNDCVLFRGEYTSLDSCPVCGASRLSRKESQQGDLPTFLLVRGWSDFLGQQTWRLLPYLHYVHENCIHPCT